MTTEIKDGRDHEIQTTGQSTGQVPSDDSSTDSTITPSAIISIIRTTVGLLTVFALSHILYRSKLR